VDAAADAGADAVKFQTWITEEVCARGAAKAEYQKTELVDEDQFEMLKRLELPYAWHAELKAHAAERKIVFLSTPDELQSARFLFDLGIPAIKIGSGELTNLPYLAEVSALGKPLILSTGMSDLAAVARALEAVRKANPSIELALLHCVSAYPAPESEMNLRCILTLRDEFKVAVGLSDHTTGSMAAILGAGLGMAVYERHLTLDRKLPGPDQASSTEPAAFAEVVQSIRKAERMMGSGMKVTAASEAMNAAAVQRVLVFARDLPGGCSISAGDIKALRSGQSGLAPSELPCVIGRSLCGPVEAGAIVRESDFQ
jgi:sialic acid synthase SpsE